MKKQQNKVRHYRKANVFTANWAVRLVFLLAFFVFAPAAPAEISDRTQDDSFLTNEDGSTKIIYNTTLWLSGITSKFGFNNLFGNNAPGNNPLDDTTGHGTFIWLGYDNNENVKRWYPDGTVKDIITISNKEKYFQKLVDDSLTMGAGVLWTNRTFFSDNHMSLQMGIKYAHDPDGDPLTNDGVGLIFDHIITSGITEAMLRIDEHDIINAKWREHNRIPDTDSVYSGIPIETWWFYDEWADLKTTCANADICTSIDGCTPYDCAQDNCSMWANEGQFLWPVMDWEDIEKLSEDNKANYKLKFIDYLDNGKEKGIHKNYSKGKNNYISPAFLALQERMIEYYFSAHDETYAFRDNTTGGLAIDGIFVDGLYFDQIGEGKYDFYGAELTKTKRKAGLEIIYKMYIDKIRGRDNETYGAFIYGTLDNNTFNSENQNPGGSITTPAQKMFFHEGYYQANDFFNVYPSYVGLVDFAHGSVHGERRWRRACQSKVDVKNNWFYPVLTPDFVDLYNPGFHLPFDPAYNNITDGMKLETHLMSKSIVPNTSVTRRPVLIINQHHAMDITQFSIHTAANDICEYTGKVYGFPLASYCRKYPDDYPQGSSWFGIEDVRDWLSPPTDNEAWPNLDGKNWSTLDEMERAKVASKKVIAMHLVRIAAMANSLYDDGLEDYPLLSQEIFDEFASHHGLPTANKWTDCDAGSPNPWWLTHSGYPNNLMGLPFVPNGGTGQIHIPGCWGFTSDNMTWANDTSACSDLDPDVPCWPDLNVISADGFGGDRLVEALTTRDRFDEVCNEYLNFLNEHENDVEDIHELTVKSSMHRWKLAMANDFNELKKCRINIKTPFMNELVQFDGEYEIEITWDYLGICSDTVAIYAGCGENLDLDNVTIVNDGSYLLQTPEDECLEEYMIRIEDKTYESSDSITVKLCNHALDNDNDGVGNTCDNCPERPNGPELGTCWNFITNTPGGPCTSGPCGPGIGCVMSQSDSDNDDDGDVCDDDIDGDTHLNITDNCPYACNSQQSDADSDGVGDVCDDPADDGCYGCGTGPICEQEC